MNEWSKARLGEVLRPIAERVAEKPVELVLSVTEKRGVIPQTEVFNKRIATNDIGKYKVLQPLDIAYNPYLLWTGAIGQWLGDEPGATSPVYECFRAKDGVEPRFLGLIFESGLLTPYFDSLAIGSIQRRRRTTPEVFLNGEIPLPPMPVQRRIVDLMAHLDNHIVSLQRERDAVVGDLKRHRANLMLNGAPRRAGEVFSILMGRQRSPARASGPNMTKYLRAANVKDGRLDLSDVKEMDFDAKERSHFQLVKGDVLVSEGSGSADAVGAAAQWNEEMPGTVCIQNTLLRFRSIQGVTVPSFVHHWCRWAYESGGFRETATGTNILHIGSTRAVEMSVGWYPPDVQERLCSLLDHYDTTAGALVHEIESLVSARARLLADLLSGLIGIPDDYDAVIKSEIQ